MSILATILAQATNATAAVSPGSAPADATNTVPQTPFWITAAMYGLFGVVIWFLFFRPQILAKKKQDETVRAAKTGDKVVTSSGLHGIITNVKDNTVILKVADNVKLEIEKSHIDKITRPTAEAEVPAKA